MVIIDKYEKHFEIDESLVYLCFCLRKWPLITWCCLLTKCLPCNKQRNYQTLLPNFRWRTTPVFDNCLTSVGVSHYCLTNRLIEFCWRYQVPEYWKIYLHFQRSSWSTPPYQLQRIKVAVYYIPSLITQPSEYFFARRFINSNQSLRGQARLYILAAVCQEIYQFNSIVEGTSPSLYFSSSLPGDLSIQFNRWRDNPVSIEQQSVKRFINPIQFLLSREQASLSI
jgi:hypothetical protein